MLTTLHYVLIAELLLPLIQPTRNSVSKEKKNKKYR